MAVFLGFYFGCLLMILLYNLHWYNVSKEKSYLYYAAFKLAIMSILFQNIHIVEWGEFALILNANIIFLFIFLFSKEFLGLSKNFKRVNKGLNYAILLIALCFIYSVITGRYAIFNQPYSLLLTPFVALGYYVYYKGFEPAKYYVAAWGISIFLIGVDDLNQFGVINIYPDIPFTLMGHIIESVILSYAISVKTNLIIKEKDQQSKILIHQAKLASMGQMLENISHQWRQPLNRIATFIINMQIYINDKYQQDEYLLASLEQSQRQLEYMSSTINDFTRFNKQAKNKEHFMVSTAVKDASNIIGQTLVTHNIAFEVVINDDFSRYSYPSELAQVVLNLIQNAQDVLLTRQVQHAFIRVLIDVRKISIQDNAGGIETDIIAHIFEPYFTTNSQPTSQGLGLYMSKIILEKNFDATIVLEQTEQNTSFNILFSG